MIITINKVYQGWNVTIGEEIRSSNTFAFSNFPDLKEFFKGQFLFILDDEFLPNDES